LAYCAEEDIAHFAELKGFPIIPCNLCGSQENLQRQVVKDMLIQWERQFPGRTETIFSAIRNVQPSQLADLNLFDFVHLETNKNAAADEADDSCAITAPVQRKEEAVQYVDVLDMR
jgi:tRNA 2-thiocytidine biosynthesis protein TtcA